MNRKTFREDDFEAFLYDGMTKEEANAYLEGVEPGTFFLRKSANTPGDIIICIKEIDQVIQCSVTSTRTSEGTQWFVRGREETKFSDIPGLLAFYKRMNFVSINLIAPIPPDRIPLEPVNPYPARRRINLIVPPNSARFSDGSGGSMPNSPRNSVLLNKMVRAVRTYVPCAFDVRALPLEEDDLVRVTAESPNGIWEGVIVYPLGRAGQRGEFPFNSIEVIENFFRHEDDRDNVNA